MDCEVLDHYCGSRVVRAPIYGAVRRRHLDFLAFALPAVFMLLLQAAVSVSMHRYNIILLPSLALASGWFVQKLLELPVFHRVYSGICERFQIGSLNDHFIRNDKNMRPLDQLTDAVALVRDGNSCDLIFYREVIRSLRVMKLNFDKVVTRDHLTAVPWLFIGLSTLVYVSLPVGASGRMITVGLFDFAVVGLFALPYCAALPVIWPMSWAFVLVGGLLA